MKLRLFALRSTATGKLLPDVYFPSKPEAKKGRDERNTAAGKIEYVVSNGPDHRHFNADARIDVRAFPK